MPVVASAAQMHPPPQPSVSRISWQIKQGNTLTRQPFWPPDARRSPTAVYGSTSMMLYRRYMLMGVNRHDRIALALPNGPEMAVAVVAVAAGATCAPLNPAYSPYEYHAYLAALNPKALIIQAGTDFAARAVARTRGISILELSPMLDAEAGFFRLTGEAHPRAELPAFARPDDVALVYKRRAQRHSPKPCR